mmetsp:Transcript_42711/g.37933  ORF Transcript_42711/g.37933 Transcript_42711/m.37933 type:complete len:489 (+) Transcript_42711:67-1533(+)
MEIYDCNPKSFSHSKRSQKFSDQKDKRKAHPNGQNLRKVSIEYYHRKYSQFTFKKDIRNPSKTYGGNRTVPLFGQTEFEKDLNIPMLTNLTYSLNKHKNWEKIDEMIKTVQADEKCLIQKGKGEKGVTTKDCDRIKLGYFDMNEMQIQTAKLIKQQQKYEKILNYDATDIDNYVKDKFYATIKQKEDKATLKRWKEIQNVKPKNISKHSHLIRIRSITARSTQKRCNLQNATVRAYDFKSYWSPIKTDDVRDYIQLDLGKDCFIEAISTKGRRLVRKANYEIDHQHSVIEYVKKYKVMIKKDDGEKIYRDKQTLNHSLDDFISLGVFNGNRDSETEVANKLRLLNDNKTGVIARYIRIYPIKYNGKKSMRVGVYGDDKMNDDAVIDNDEDDDNKGDLIKNSKVPAVIITIEKQCDSYNRDNCWDLIRRYGVFSCSCWNCSGWRKNKFKSRRQRSMATFKQQVKKWNRVSDFGLDNDWIGYHPNKAGGY